MVREKQIFNDDKLQIVIVFSYLLAQDAVMLTSLESGDCLVLV